MKQIKEKLRFTLFDRYILMDFIRPYIGALLFIIILTHVTEFLERLDFFNSIHAGGKEILLYYIYKSPYLIIQFSPVAILFGVVFSLGLKAKNRELISIITGGVNFFRVVLYLYLAGLFLSVSLIVFNDIIGVKAQEKVGEMNRKFNGINDRYDKQDLNMYGKENNVYHITYYHFNEKKMDKVQILKTSKVKERIEYRIDAQSAIWNKEKMVWIFSNGMIRNFDNKGSIMTVDEFKGKEIDLPEKPKDFDYQQKDIDELNIWNAWIYIKNLRSKGFNTQKEWVDFHLKFSFPFAGLLMMLIGAPLSIYSSRSVLIISFALALIGSIVYWVFLSVGIALGKNGVLPPLPAVWMGNIFFALVSCYLHKKVAT